MRRIAERYGQSVLILREDGEITARAFFQPLPEQGETAVDTVVSLGGLDRRLWLYLGPEEENPVFDEARFEALWEG